MHSLYHLLHTIICLSFNGEIPSPLTVYFQPRNSGVMFRDLLLAVDSHCLHLTEAFRNSYCLRLRFFQNNHILPGEKCQL